jgi:hypothetical protein
MLIKKGTLKAIRFVLQTGLLEQFRLYALESHETRPRPTREFEDREDMEGRRKRMWTERERKREKVRVASDRGSFRKGTFTRRLLLACGEHEECTRPPTRFL